MKSKPWTFIHIYEPDEERCLAALRIALNAKELTPEELAAQDEARHSKALWSQHRGIAAGIRPDLK